MIYFAIFFDAMKGEFVWDMQSGICNEFDFEAGQCLSIENPKTFSKLVAQRRGLVKLTNVGIVEDCWSLLEIVGNC